MERLSTLKPQDGTAPVQRERLALWEGGKGQDEQGGAYTAGVHPGGIAADSRAPIRGGS